VSFFGHGYAGGPILVNSWERPEYKAGGAKALERDPFDKDGRVKDFNSTNMPLQRWRNIRNAFHTDGFCWLWGCVFHRIALGIYSAMARSRAYRAKKLGQHDDNDVFELRFKSGFAKKYYQHARGFFPPDKDGKHVLKFNKTLKDIKDAFKRSLLMTYAGRFSQDLGVDCIAALLGTYSVHETRNRRRPNPLMLIANGGHNHGFDFRKMVKWYETYFNITLDPEGRNYAIYKKNVLAVWFREWQELINTNRTHPTP